MMSEYEKAFNELPDCVGVDPMESDTIESLVWFAETEIQLIKEGQDGTDPKDLARLMAWHDKWALPPELR